MRGAKNKKIKSQLRKNIELLKIFLDFGKECEIDGKLDEILKSSSNLRKKSTRAKSLTKIDLKSPPRK